MLITYDPQAKAVYIYVSPLGPFGEGDTRKRQAYQGIVSKTKPLGDTVNVDYTRTGAVFGIEVLNVDTSPEMAIYSASGEEHLRIKILSADTHDTSF